MGYDDSDRETNFNNVTNNTPIIVNPIFKLFFTNNHIIVFDNKIQENSNLLQALNINTEETTNIEIGNFEESIKNKHRELNNTYYTSHCSLDNVHVFMVDVIIIMISLVSLILFVFL